MNLKSIFLPWLVIRELEADVAFMDEAFWTLMAETQALRAEVAKMDGDGDGRIGGSRKRLK